MSVGYVDSFAVTWARRVVSVGLIALAALTTVASAPVLVALAVVVDLVRPGRWVAIRSIGFLALFLGYELAGLARAALLWLRHRLAPDGGEEAFAVRNFELQCWWARRLWTVATSLFDIRAQVEGLDEAAVGRGPYLLLMRHASTADTLLPAVFVSDATGVRLRYVLKRELLWDPCLDVVGQRLPNAFVQRGSDDNAGEIARVVEIAEGLGRRDGVVVFPEGTRFTPAKRRRVLERMAERAPGPMLERARELRHVLPPRLGGTLALLSRADPIDVVFGAHVGFDSVTTLWDFWHGALIGRRVRLRFWRVPAGRIPHDRAERIDWLLGQWKRVDDWIGEQRDG